MWSTEGQLPLEATRDALGVARIMLAAEQTKTRPNLMRVAGLRTAVEALTLALELAASPPGTLGHKAAWSHAERALALVGKDLMVFDEARPIVLAGVNRVVRRG